MSARKMTPRVEMMKERLSVEKYPFSATKAKLWIQAYQDNEGMPEIYKRAKAFEYVMDQFPLFIQEGELIVGNGASKPMGLEVNFWSGLWQANEIDALRSESDGCGFLVDEDVADEMLRQNAYWKNRNFTDRMEQLLNPELTVPFLEKGVALPPWKPGIGWSGKAESGLGCGPYLLVSIEWDEVLRRGTLDYAREAREELRGMINSTYDDCKKKDFLKSSIICMEALARLGGRFSALAKEMSENEKDETRKAELLKISEICARVPAYPARSFHEAVQCVWFIFLCMNPNMVCSLGRMDQYLYPYYKADKDAGLITEEEAIELLECFRIKDMELNRTGSIVHRQKWSGMAKWHNCIIGGVRKDGSDATNDVTFMLLEAAYRTNVPHHTITLRVHENSPKELMRKAAECVKKGMGLPAFVSDKSYMQYALDRGVPLEEARDYTIGGCIDLNLPGKSRILAQPMVVVPLCLEWAMNHGVEMQHGKKIGLDLGGIEDYITFEKLYDVIVEEMRWAAKITGEHNNTKCFVWNELFPDPVTSIFMNDGIKVGRNYMDRTFPLENAVVLCSVGMVNLANSLAAIKKLVYEDKVLTFERLKEAMDANWEGEENEKIRKMCLDCPKYGNDDSFVDDILAGLYDNFVKAAESVPCALGGTHKASCISITAHWPGGQISWATPDGRYNGESLSDGGLSAGRGDDVCGPTALLNSCLKVNQDSMQAVLLNMKFHPTSLKTDDDLEKFCDLVKIYLTSGGKHMQFNVVNREALLEAQQEPEKHREIIVRIAGYSTYFTMLNKAMQEEVIGRTEQHL